MTTFSGSPCLQKGALIVIDLLNPLASVVVFQYNPDTLTRTISPVRGQGEMLQLKAPPQETIKLNIEAEILESYLRTAWGTLELLSTANRKGPAGLMPLSPVECGCKQKC